MEQWYHQHQQAPYHVYCMVISNEAFSPSPSFKMKKNQTVQEVKTTSNIGRGVSSVNLQLSTCTAVIVLAMKQFID